MVALRTKRTFPLRTVLWFVLGPVLVIQVYLLLHELGHALAAVLVGGTVTGVDARMWSPRPHASFAGNVTSEARAFIMAGGTLLPMLVWTTVLVALPRRLPTHAATLRFGASAGVLVGLMPWFVLPWPALHARYPGDDVVRFTQMSGWPAGFVVALAAAVLSGGFALFWWRIGGIEALRSLRATTAIPVPRGTLRLSAVMLLGLMLSTVAMDARSIQHSSGGVTLPEAPALGDVNLDGTTFDAVLAQGAVGDAPLALVIGFEDMEGGPFGLVLIDGAGHEHPLGSFGEDTMMGVASSRPRLTVAEGPWTVRLWAEGTVGRIRLWVDEDPMTTDDHSQ